LQVVDDSASQILFSLLGKRRRDRFVSAEGGQLTLEWIPDYAPELNPVEHIWSYVKNANCPNSVAANSDN